MTRAVRLATDADVDRLAATMARAFYDDPFQVWSLPDAGTRLDILTALFALQIRHGSLPLGASWCTDDGAAASCWAPPGRWRPTPDAQRAMAVMPEIVGDRIAVMREAYVVTVAAHPEEPEHWYLQGVGTEPDLQGRGLGRAVLTPVLEQCDSKGEPAYLECTKPENVALYEHLGFAVRSTYQLPGGGPQAWTMWRDPRMAG